MDSYAERRATTLARSLEPRVSKLGLDVWQQQVYGLIFFHAYKSPQRMAYEEVDREIQIITLLEKLEKMETIALLKLAVWKGQCQMNPSKKLDTFLDYLRWDKYGWKVDKKVAKNQSAMGVVAQGVQGFL
ncbi:hypothetical protein MPSEU_000106400 [Mayamaea pseudoterrestris]|nr:hypothetical protein MPSEU_000106400 [Mayamaea pseudoterrestris]